MNENLRIRHPELETLETYGEALHEHAKQIIIQAHKAGIEAASIEWAQSKLSDFDKYVGEIRKAQELEEIPVAYQIDDEISEGIRNALEIRARSGS